MNLIAEVLPMPSFADETPVAMLHDARLQLGFVDARLTEEYLEMFEAIRAGDNALSMAARIALHSSDPDHDPVTEMKTALQEIDEDDCFGPAEQHTLSATQTRHLGEIVDICSRHDFDETRQGLLSLWREVNFFSRLVRTGVSGLPDIQSEGEQVMTLKDGSFAILEGKTLTVFSCEEPDNILY